MKQKNYSIKPSQIISLSVLLLSSTTSLYGQSVQQLQSNYTGNTTWNAGTGTLTFTSTGAIRIPNKAHNTWAVPTTVKKIVINDRVTVTGRFDVSEKITIEGKSKNNSTIYGTSRQRYAKDVGGGNGDALSAIRATKGDVTIKNLTCLNSKGFAFSHRGKGFMTITDCRIIDNRGGHGNNSDGIVTWGGGLVERCYFSTGDDVIKVYGNITVNDCHIVMIDNAVPIQFGWGSYGSGAKGTFNNLKVSGNKGRVASGRAVISARKGTYNKTLKINSATIENSNASLFSFREGRGNFGIEIDKAKISVKNFKHEWNDGAKATIKICGTTYGKSTTKTSWDCR